MLLSILFLPLERLVKLFRKVRFRVLAVFLLVFLVGLVIGAYLQGTGRLDILGLLLTEPS